MNAKNILVPAVAGTSLMTLFSYLISESKKKNFSEPKLLSSIEKNLVSKASKEIVVPAGWITHYSIGAAITILFNIFWNATDSNPNLKNGIILGGLSGLSAIAAWKLLLKFHPVPHSNKYYSQFYKQLFAAHFIFAITVALTKRVMK